MTYKPVPVWKEAPFLRLLPPFIGGILLQWQMGILVTVWWLLTWVCISVLIFYLSFRSFIRFKYYGVAGLLLHLLLLAAGALITGYHDVRRQSGWIGHTGAGDCSVVVTLEEPLHKKAASYKAVASIEGTIRQHQFIQASGQLFVYFAGSSPPPHLSYHSRILFAQPLQQISNLDNPGGFDYKQYCAFQNLYHQVYLRPGEYVLLPEKDKDDLAGKLFSGREKIVGVLRKFISAREAGLAEALLIGYKDDLDKELVQSYVNTGVVHIIAISGLHLGLIYWLLMQLFGWIKFRRLQWMKFVMIIGALWVFALLTGGSASVMRSALMFTFLAAGQLANKRSSTCNSLAASAFLLLCYNPYWLWDAGFQLSYGAVLGIVLFMQPLYHCLYVKNKLLDAVWKLLATSLAAQILTAPVSIYLFHQFPLSFLLTNLVAVPLSSLVVLTEIGLCVCAAIPPLAHWGGVAVSRMIEVMNGFVIYMEKLPFSMWGGLQISLLQTGLLYAIIAALSSWLWQKKPRMLLVALGLVLLFTALRTVQFIPAQQQQRIIVYNIPKHGAVELASGRHALLVADSALLANAGLIRANIEPAGRLYRFNHASLVPSDRIALQGFYFGEKRVLLCNGSTAARQPEKRVGADILIVFGNRPDPEEIIRSFHCRWIVLSSTVSLWKIKSWKESCRKAGVYCYPVSEKGAFVFQAD